LGVWNLDTSLEKVLSRLERLERDLDNLKARARRSEERTDEEGPPAYVEKIEKVLEDELEHSSASTEDLLVLAALRKEAGKIVDSLSIASRGRPDEFVVSPETQASIKGALDVLQTLSNEKRLQILVEVFKGGRYPKELTDVTGLDGGALYHHLDTLTEAGFAERDKQGKVVLTPRGKLLTNLISILSRINQWKFGSRKQGTPQT